MTTFTDGKKTIRVAIGSGNNVDITADILDCYKYDYDREAYFVDDQFGVDGVAEWIMDEWLVGKDDGTWDALNMADDQETIDAINKEISERWATVEEI